MPSRMLTLFGEEFIPEQMQAAPKVPVDAADDISNPSGGSNIEPAPGNGDMLGDWKPTKKYYTIGEVSKLFNVRTSHIRFWTIEFELNVRTTAKGDRLYTPAIIFELRTIYHLLKERGFTIPGAKARLKDVTKAPLETFDLRQALLQLRNQLTGIRNELL